MYDLNQLLTLKEPNGAPTTEKSCTGCTPSMAVVRGENNSSDIRRVLSGTAPPPTTVQKSPQPKIIPYGGPFGGQMHGHGGAQMMLHGHPGYAHPRYGHPDFAGYPHGSYSAQPTEVQHATAGVQPSDEQSRFRNDAEQSLVLIEEERNAMRQALADSEQRRNLAEESLILMEEERNAMRAAMCSATDEPVTPAETVKANPSQNGRPMVAPSNPLPYQRPLLPLASSSVASEQVEPLCMSLTDYLSLQLTMCLLK